MDIRTDKNYEIIRDAYCMLEADLDYANLPRGVIGLILSAKDLLDEACRIYEFGDDETDAGN